MTERKEREIEVITYKEEIERLNSDCASLNVLHATRGKNIAGLPKI
jgi:hypothetical protein